MGMNLIQPDKNRIICNNVKGQRLRLRSYIHPFNEIKLEKMLSFVALDHSYYYIENMDDPEGKTSFMEFFVRPAPHTKTDIEAFLSGWRTTSKVILSQQASIESESELCSETLPK